MTVSIQRGFAAGGLLCLVLFTSGCETAPSAAEPAPEIYGPQGGLPPGHSWKESHGPDFTVYQAATDKGSVLLYDGFAPDFIEPEDADRRRGRIGEMTVWWIYSEQIEDGVRWHKRDCLAMLFSGVLHAQIVSRSERDADKLAAGLATMQWSAISKRKSPELREEIEVRMRDIEKKFLDGFFPRKTREELTPADRSRLRSMKQSAFCRVMGDDWGPVVSELSKE